MEHIKYS